MNKYNKFHGNYLEDEWIDNNLQLPHKGVFIDVGASDAIKRSNTYHFEMNGWTGLCIEADKYYFSDSDDREGLNNPLPKFRKESINAAVGKMDGEVLFISRDRKALSEIWSPERFGKNVSPSYSVKCYKLETILHKYNIKYIDILDIACRGHDWKIWNSFDYKKYVPKVIITEHSSRGFERDERIRDFLLSTGEYDLCCQTEVTYIFKHKSIEYK